MCSSICEVLLWQCVVRSHGWNLESRRSVTNSVAEAAKMASHHVHDLDYWCVSVSCLSIVLSTFCQPSPTFSKIDVSKYNMLSNNGNVQAISPHGKFYLPRSTSRNPKRGAAAAGASSGLQDCLEPIQWVKCNVQICNAIVFVSIYVFAFLFASRKIQCSSNFASW